MIYPQRGIRVSYTCYCILQNKKGEVTPYQVKQVIALIRQYNLTLQE
jgi:hypothetical protein